MIGLLILLFALSTPTLEQNTDDVPVSPCPDVFQYERPETEKGRWYGVVNVATDTILYSLWLNIVVDSKADILGNWIGDVTTQDNLDFKIENTEKRIDPGPPTPVRFFIQYNSANRVPRLKSIRLNGEEICNVNRKTNLARATGRAGDQNPSPSNTPRAVPTSTAGTTNKFQCGQVLKAPVTVKGVRSQEGQWPWQVALYKTQTIDNDYSCGGTLVSHRHVVTAAHCVTVRGTKTLVPRNKFTVFLGKHNLRASVDGEQIRFIQSITIHPNYNSTTFDRDIAVIELKEPVTYTDWVQPACLWPANLKHIGYIIGTKGSVVRWGIDDFSAGATAEELTHVEMTVVDTETCIRSYPEFFVRRTSKYTFCAGSDDGAPGSSVCKGDSGSGMVFLNQGTWYIRGLVSQSVAIRTEGGCDPSHYVIFTDVAKLLPWVQRNIYD